MKTEYSFTLTDDLSDKTPTNIYPYLYKSTGWRDQLVSYNGETFAYDEIGNPTTYRNKTLSWSHARQLDSFGDIASFKYNANGIRISKSVNGITTKYYLNGNKIISQTDATNTLFFYYGTDGITGFNHNGTDYFYKKNIQGDIIGIYNPENKLICKYIYDAWGNHVCRILSNNGEYVDIADTSNYNINSNYISIANLNPFRYRSYYFDTETNLYYLNSRYYDPQTGRFINADDISILEEGQDFFNGLNLYTYCGNNPIMNTDESGNKWWDWLWKIVVSVVIVVAIGVAAAFTGGTAGVVLGSAFYGAVTGGLSSALIGGVIGGISGGWSGFLNEFANGLLSGVIIGGATAALTAGINIATGAVKIVGSAQKTGTFFHRMASNVQAGKMAIQIGRYSQITLNKSLNKAGLIGRKMPDVIGTARWGKNLLIEVTSKSQTYAQMAAKLTSLVSANPNSTWKVISWAAWISKLFM